MGDEQHAAKLRTARIERREPRLSEPGREDDEPGLIAGRSRVFEGLKSRDLNVIGLDWALGRLGLVSAASTIGRRTVRRARYRSIQSASSSFAHG